MSGSTTLLKYIKPTVSGDADVWGGYLNTNFDSIDKLQNVVTTTGSANAYLLTSGQSSLAYATGQRFRCKLNFTCSGSSTLNVDSIGAKTIKKRDATTNVSSGDLVSGQVYTFTYDGTNFVLETYVTSDVQPLDATLTALAALSWSSGNPLVQFTAADTVSLTLTPSVSSVTAQNSAGASTPAATIKNTTDNATVQALKVGGARATPTASDAAYVSYVLNNSSSAEKEFARDLVFGTTVTAAGETGLRRWSLIVAGTLTAKMDMTSTTLRANADDGLALGDTTHGWSDVFLATGGVINWNNGTFTLTQSSTNLAASGSIQARTPLSSETTGTLTVASANTEIMASGGITLPNSVFSAQDKISIHGNGTARTITRGAGVTMYIGGVDSATGTLTANGVMVVNWRTAQVCVLQGNVS